MPDEILNEEEQEEVTTPVNEDSEPTPAPPTISDRVKLALRISHNLLDAEITQVITSARQELERAGVSHEVAYSDLELVETAIITYAKEYYAGEVRDAERYKMSFQYQCDCIRKSSITVEES